MSGKTISKNISPIDFTRRETTLVLAALCFFSISIGHTQTAWVDQKFTDYTAGATLNTTLSPTLITNVGSPTLYTTITNDSDNNMARYQKTTSQTTGSQVMFAFSPTNEMTARVSGYVSFKIKQNINPTIATNSSLDVGIGDNVITNNTSSNAKRLIGISFYQSTSTNNIQIKSGATTITNTSYTNSTTYPKVQIWFNDSDSTTMPYTDPSGASQNLSTNSFVVYLGTTLLTPSASGTALTGASGASLSIGKVGFSTASGGAIDFNFDDVYAANSAPATASIPITSLTTASAMNQYPFSFAVLADGATSYSASGLPNGLSINPTTGVISGSPNVSNVTAVFNATINVSGPGGITGTGPLAITVNAYPASAPVITPSASTASGNVGVAFSYQISASNTPRSYAAANLPAGLNLNTTTGLISGFPSTVGDTTVTLTAENPAGTSFSQDLTISIGIAPPNIFTGANNSLNTSSSWSLGSTPTASANPGSYTDLVFSSSATSLTTSSGNVFGKSWNVTNGSSYSFSSVSTAPTTFKIGNNNPVSSPFYNSVAGSDNVLVYLTNGSRVTLTATNTLTSANSSTVALYNSGSMQIGSGSIISILAPLIETGTSAVVTKIGSGKLLLGGSNSVSGGFILQEGAIEATVPDSMGKGAVTLNGGELNVSGENAWVGSKALTISGGRATFSASNNYTGVTTMTGGTLQLSNVAALGGSNTAGTFTLSGGTIEALVDYDLGHTWTTSTTVGSITFDKLDGKTTTVNGPVTLNATSGATLSLYKLASNANPSSVVTKTGNGTLKLMGGTPSGGWIGNWQINAGTLYVNTTSSGALGSNNAVVMNGGNLLFSKGVGSSGTYSGHGQDTALSVLAETTVTLDPNAATLASNNTVSFTNLSVGTQTIHVAKGVNTKSSATDSSYTDPQLSFKTATLTGQTTLDVAANVETVMQAGSGTGGVTKIGAGKLSLSSNPSIYAATATTALNGDAVSGFTITYAGNPSFPYQTAPTVTISAPASGTQATATATIDNGLVTGLTIVNPGSGYTVAPIVTIAGPGVPNSYSGSTTVNSGTLALSGSSASSITIGSAGVLQTALVTSNSATTTGSLIFNSGAKVRPVGTPTEIVYTLITAGDGITGTPALETSIQGYVLAVEGNSLVLRQQVAKLTPTIIVTPSVGGYVYSGSIQGPGVNEVNKGGSTGGVTLSYAGTGSTTYGPSATPPINAGTYSLTATVASDSSYNEASSIPTAFTISKATPTVSVPPNASAVTAGALLSSSTLSGGTVTVVGTFAWTTPGTVVSTTASYPVTFTPTDGANYNTASSTASVTANPAGTTYSGWLSGGTASDAAFLDYVFGAVTAGTLDSSLKPTVAVIGGNLVLTYNVRQGTVGLTVMAQTSADLATGAAGWGTSGVTDVAVGTPRTVNGVSVQQRTASVSASGGKKFLRIQAVQAAP